MRLPKLFVCTDPKRIPTERKLAEARIHSQDMAVFCYNCNNYLYITRWRAKITKQGKYSLAQSVFIPKALQKCDCGQTGCLVDNRGNLRVYGESSRISLVAFAGDVQICRGLPLTFYKHARISKRVIDGPRVHIPKPIYVPQHQWTTNHVDLSYLPKVDSTIILPVPMSPFALRNINASTVFRDYHMHYAYNHNLIIITRQYWVLPSGVLISIEDAKLNELLDQPIEHKLRSKLKTWKGIIMSSKVDYDHQQLSCELVASIVASLEKFYKLPRTSAQYVDYQTCGYRQTVKFYEDHNRTLAAMSTIAKEIMRAGDRKHTAEYVCQFINNTLKLREFKKSVPMESYVLSYNKYYRYIIPDHATHIRMTVKHTAEITNMPKRAFTPSQGHLRHV
jgi:hypothetical protein